MKLQYGVDNMDEKFLDCFYGKTYKLYNLLGLIDDKNIKGFKDEGGDKINYDVSREKEKSGMIREMLGLIGYDNVLSKESIGRDAFEKGYKKATKSRFFKRLEYARPLFGLSKWSPIDSSKRFLGFINTILGEYGLKINTKRKITTVKIDGKRKSIAIYKYCLITIDNIIEFIDYRVRKNHTFHNTLNLVTDVKNKVWEHLYDKNKKRSCSEYLFI